MGPMSMSSSSMEPPAAAANEALPDKDELVQVRAILKSLAQTITVIKLYPAGHDHVRRYRDDLYDRLNGFLGQDRPLDLGIGENAFTYLGQVVYQDDNLQKSLPYFFFKDGMLRLSFLPGLTPADLQDFLALIRDAFLQVSGSADVVDLMWQKEIEHIRFFAPNEFLTSKVAVGTTMPLDFSIDPRVLTEGTIGLAPEDRPGLLNAAVEPAVRESGAAYGERTAAPPGRVIPPEEEAEDAQAAGAENGETTGVTVKVRPHPKFKEIYQVTLEDGAQRLGTRNLTPGLTVYNERLVKFKGVEYRVWDAFRSKLAAAINKGLQNVPIEPGSKVLYLGAASGTTPSHVSDIVGETGYVYCVEFAQRSIRDLVNNVAAFRSNISPLLEDARMPERYAMFISGKVDTIYSDVAQPEQARLLADNADVFLKPEGWVMLAVKSQSIDVTMNPDDVYRQEANIMRKRGFEVTEVVNLEPFDKAHAMIVAQRSQ